MHVVAGLFSDALRSAVIRDVRSYCWKTEDRARTAPGQKLPETIYLDSDHVEQQAGHWNWIYDRVALYDMRIPQGFAPEYFSDSGSHGSAAGPSYSRPGYWSVKAESHWGKTILPIFPDDDINFIRTKP